jgi:excisionase family DNA binding protein
MKPCPRHDEHLLTCQQVADRLNVNIRFVTRCLQEQRLRYLFVGRRIHIPTSAVTEFLETNTVFPAKGPAR